MKAIKFLTLLFAAVVAFAACGPIEPPKPPVVGPGEDTTSTEDPNVSDGAGTEAEPYSVSQYLGMTIPEKEAGKDKVWIEGYIVGSYNFDMEPKFVIGADNAVNTSLLIAADPNSDDTYKVVSIKLMDDVFRAKLNLLDNAGNYKMKVKLYGLSEKYCGINGLINIERAFLNGEEIKDAALEGFFTESFKEGQGDFTINDVELSGLEKVWSHDATYKQMKAGSFNGGNNATESWLISPEIDLTGKTSASLTFDHSGKQFGAPFSNLTIQVAESGSEDWTQVTIPTYMTGNDNTFVNAGNMDLTKFAGKKIKFAFKYTSTASAGGNWYVKNVVVNAK